jgi:hypothetical protein
VRGALGIGLLTRRARACLLTITTLPVSLLAQDSAAAILRSNGGVLLNKNPAPASSALYPDDLIETQKTLARIEATGSTADLNPDTMVQFEGYELVLDHGSLAVNTSRGLRVRIGCVTVTPVNAAEWTHYEVADVDGKITVSASKSDVYIDSRSSGQEPATAQTKKPNRSDRTIVHEGEQKSRDEKCAAAEVKDDRLAGRGAIMNSPWAKGAAAAGIASLVCWALCQSDNPLSPSDPSKH